MRSGSDEKDLVVGRNLVVPTVVALLEEVGDTPAVGLDPSLRLDGGVRYHDRSGAADRWFRSWAKGEVAQSVDALDDWIGRTDDPRWWKVRFDPPIGGEDGFDVRHGESKA